MAKYGSPNFGAFLVDGYNILAAAVQGLNWKDTANTQKCHGLGDAWEKSSPTGLQKAELIQSGAYLDDTAGGIHAGMSAVPTTTRIVCIVPLSNTIGKLFIGFQGAITAAYEVLGKVNALVNANISYVISGALERGQILQPWTQISGTTTTTAADLTTDISQRTIPITSATKANPCVVTTSVPHGLTTGQKVLISGNSLSTPDINQDLAVTVISSTTFSVAVNTSASTGTGTGGTLVLSSTVNGGAAYINLSQFAGLTSLAGKVQHSTDNSSWSDLAGASFAAITGGPGTDPNCAQRVAVAAGTTINRYTRAVLTFTGGGTVTALVGISRGFNG